jgi:hypothetical protein
VAIALEDVHPSPEAPGPSWRDPERLPAEALSTATNRRSIMTHRPWTSAPSAFDRAAERLAVGF